MRQQRLRLWHVRACQEIAQQQWRARLLLLGALLVPAAKGMSRSKLAGVRCRQQPWPKGLMAADMHSTPESMERRTGGKMPMLPCSRWLHETECRTRHKLPGAQYASRPHQKAGFT